MSRAKYLVPGSILSGKVDVTQPITTGMSTRINDFFFDNSPVFRLGPAAAVAGARAMTSSTARRRSAAVSSVGTRNPYEHGIIAVDVPLGKGRVLLFGPRDSATPPAATRNVQAAVRRRLAGERRWVAVGALLHGVTVATPDRARPRTVSSLISLSWGPARDAASARFARAGDEATACVGSTQSPASSLSVRFCRYLLPPASYTDSSRMGGNP